MRHGNAERLMIPASIIHKRLPQWNPGRASEADLHHAGERPVWPQEIFSRRSLKSALPLFLPEA